MNDRNIITVTNIIVYRYNKPNPSDDYVNFQNETTKRFGNNTQYV